MRLKCQFRSLQSSLFTYRGARRARIPGQLKLTVYKVEIFVARGELVCGREQRSSYARATRQLCAVGLLLPGHPREGVSVRLSLFGSMGPSGVRLQLVVSWCCRDGSHANGSGKACEGERKRWTRWEEPRLYSGFCENLVMR
jgi:hypothetical protein